MDPEVRFECYIHGGVRTPIESIMYDFDFLLRGNLKLKTTTYVLLCLSIFSAYSCKQPRKEISFILIHLLHPKV